MTNIDISPEAVERLDAALASQIGDDISVIFNHESLFRRSRGMISALSAALTQSRAETAAAYERAARRVEREGHSLGDEIRTLATPDQTAALDKLIAEAEALAVEKTAAMVRTWRNTTPMTGEECANAILAAIPQKDAPND